MKKWVIPRSDEMVISTLQRGSDLSRLCCMVLAARGCTELAQVRDLIGSESLSDPFLLRDMQAAVDCINDAIDCGKRICVYGDYDCDGVMATAILYSFLLESGADVRYRLPEREEGYGLNEAVIRELHADGVELIVTVDNGIAAVQEAELIAELGMALVITDHHQPGSVLPKAHAIVDAHREDNYSPFRHYCGAGIALLLVAAMLGGDTEMALEQFGDLAAIATVADVVTLTGENRFLVHMGLQYLENTERPGLRALREKAGLAGKPITSTAVAFSIAPRINAAGRMASPTAALELVLAEQPQQAAELAERIHQLNADRTEAEAAVMQGAEAQLQAEQYERVLVLDGAGWHKGIIGIAASRVVERFGKPAFLIAVKDGVGVGSARSYGSFSIFDCLTACSEYLVKFGGHPAAGGFTIQEDQIPAFRAAVKAYAAAQHPSMPEQELQAACALSPDQLTVEEVDSLSALQPFGCGNPEPLFAIENAKVTGILPLSQGKHTKLLVQVGDVPLQALCFRRTPEQLGVSVGGSYHMMVQLGLNTFQGQTTVSLNVQDIRRSGLPQTKILSAMRAYEAYRRGEALSKAYYQAMLPSREDCMAVYQRIPAAGVMVEQLALEMPELNYCKVRIALDAFAELGLITFTPLDAAVMRCPVRQKVDLASAETLQNLKRKLGEVLV